MRTLPTGSWLASWRPNTGVQRPVYVGVRTHTGVHPCLRVCTCRHLPVCTHRHMRACGCTCTCVAFLYTHPGSRACVRVAVYHVCVWGAAPLRFCPYTFTRIVFHVGLCGQLRDVASPPPPTWALKEGGSLGRW